MHTSIEECAKEIASLNHEQIEFILKQNFHYNKNDKIYKHDIFDDLVLLFKNINKANNILYDNFNKENFDNYIYLDNIIDVLGKDNIAFRTKI